MYVRTPCTSAAMIDEYPAVSLSSFAVQTVWPVILSSFTMPAPGPPGVTTTCGPSTSGDSLISHRSLGTAEVLQDVALPHHRAVGLEARQVAVLGEDVQTIAVDRRCAARA